MSWIASMPAANDFTSHDSMQACLRETSSLMQHAAVGMDAGHEASAVSAYPDLVKLTGDMKKTLVQHRAQLQEEIGDLGNPAPRGGGGWPEAIPPRHESLAAGESDSRGGPSSPGGWPASGLLRKQAIVLGTVAASLAMLHALATARQHDSLAATTQRQLHDVTGLLMRSHLLLPTVVIDESGRREPIAAATDAQDLARRHVKTAWRTATGDASSPWN